MFWYILAIFIIFLCYTIKKDVEFNQKTRTISEKIKKMEHKKHV